MKEQEFISDCIKKGATKGKAESAWCELRIHAMKKNIYLSDLNNIEFKKHGNWLIVSLNNRNNRVDSYLCDC